MVRGSPFFVAVAAVAVWTGTACGGLYFDVFPASADGSMNLVEGYSIAGDGAAPLAKSWQRMAFLGFNAPSDGPDGVPAGASKGGVADSGDGVLLSDWLVGRKVVRAELYFRDATYSTCDKENGQGSWINDPVQIVGFRVANSGPFVDRGDFGGGFADGAAGYDAPLLEGGENAPPAWRVAPGPYACKGDIAGGEYYRLSYAAAENSGMDVRADQPWFDSSGQGCGGYSASANRFAFGWIVMNAATTGQMVNSDPIDWTDCTGTYGEQEPRDFAGDGSGAQGWYAARIDRAIIDAMARPSGELKGLVLDATNAPNLRDGQPYSNLYWTREPAGGVYGPYLAITATLAGDVNNDGCVNVIDLLAFALWPAIFPPPGPGPDLDPDLNGDGIVNVLDLLALARDWGKCIE